MFSYNAYECRRRCLEGKVEAAEAVAGETVRAALEHDGRGTVVFHDGRDDRLE
jgi:hypothetical protein